jgi:DNA repair exonuclease SbcCD ATPase subunit
MSILADIKNLPQLKTELADLKLKVEGIPDLEQSLNESLAETKSANDKLAEINSKLTALESEKSALAKAFEDYKASEPARTATYSASVIASVGINPVQGKATETEQGNKPDFSKLSGIERAKAAHMAASKTK